MLKSYAPGKGTMHLPTVRIALAPSSSWLVNYNKYLGRNLYWLSLRPSASSCNYC